MQETVSNMGARGGAVGWCTVQQARRSRVRFPMVSLEYCHWHNPSGHTMALGSIRHLTEMSTRNTLWGLKAAGAYGWQPILICRLSWNLGSSNSWNPQGLSRSVQELLYILLRKIISLESFSEEYLGLSQYDSLTVPHHSSCRHPTYLLQQYLPRWLLF